MNKKIVSIITSIIGIIVLVAAFFFYQHSGKNDLKAEHTKYLALINDNHDFDGGLKRLETLDTDEGQEIFKNIKTEIKITKELKNIDTSLDNKDVNAAKKSLEKVDTLTVDNTFDKAIEWLKEDITNYDKAKKEIDEDKSGNISSIIDKYRFNHSALKAKLATSQNKQVKNNETQNSNNQPTQETKDQYKVDDYDAALAQNYNYYQSSIFSYIKAEVNKSSSDSGVKADRVEYGGIDSRGIIVKVFDNEKGEVGHYIFKYNANANTCTLDSVQAGPVLSYKAIYHI